MYSHLPGAASSLFLPDFTVLPRVHGGAHGALKVLHEVLGVAEGADDTEFVWTVRVGHQALMGTLRGLNRTPHLYGKENQIISIKLG